MIYKKSSDKYKKRLLVRAYNIRKITISQQLSQFLSEGLGCLTRIFPFNKNCCACKKSAPFDPVWLLFNFNVKVFYGTNSPRCLKLQRENQKLTTVSQHQPTTMRNTQNETNTESKTKKKQQNKPETIKLFLTKKNPGEKKCNQGS